MRKDIACIILAAGKGERMKSSAPKVLHQLCGRPMLSYVLGLARDLKIKRTVVVLGHKHAEVKKLLAGGVKVAVQKRLVGTADAVKQALPALKNFRGTVLVLYADNPLLKKETVKKLLEYHIKNNLDATLLGAQMNKPRGYGRILRDKYAGICGIVEEKDADDFEKAIKEINTGIACFNKEKLAFALKYVRANNRKREYYLTDTIGILYKKGCLIDSIRLSDIEEALGINSRLDLARANKIMQARVNQRFMEEGVSIIDPDSTFIGYSARIGADSVIYPFTVIESGVKIGRRCFIGPFAHLREGTVVRDDVVLGNFTEVIRSTISSKTLAKHFSYIGDSRIGKQVNLGAGCVMANFNGARKNITIVKDKAFIGSGAVLVAPVKIGKAAIVGAGAVVPANKNVAGGVTVVGVPARVIKK